MIDQPIEILLVEDNPNDVELTLRALRRHNIANHVLVVGDGAQALDYLFARGEYEGRDVNSPPKVVLLDLKLPKVDGFEVLAALRADPRTTTVPVVILTSSSEERDVARGYQGGANSYVVKPVDFEQFAQAVSDLGLYWLLLNRVPEAGTV
jgi:CheY-like chemotaxis protein